VLNHATDWQLQKVLVHHAAAEISEHNKMRVFGLGQRYTSADEYIGPRILVSLVDI
jgi:hypothetical protein